MGAFLNMGSTARRTVASAASASDELADQQKEAIRYGEGAAGEELAAAEQQKVKDLGQKLIDTYKVQGISSGDQWERAAKMVTHGYDPDVVEAPWLAKAADSLSWLDKLGATVRFGIGDIFGLDTAAGVGGRDGSEFGAQDFFDIWGGRWESIRARHGEEVVGEEGRFSGGQMLNNMGWDTSDKDNVSGVNRFFHGIVGFGTELITDPLTYVTGGLAGVSKKAALAATENLVTKATTNAVRTVLKGSADDVLEHAFERTLAGRIRPLAKEALEKAQAEAGEKLTDDVAAGIVERIGLEVGNESVAEIGGLIAQRSFKNMPKDFIKFADANKASYLGGGLRLTANPVGSKGIRIPRTQGKGRALTRGAFGTPVGSDATRGFLGFRTGDYGQSGVRGLLDKPAIRATTRWRDMMEKIGVENNVLRAFQEGRPEAAQLLRTSQGATRRAAQTGFKELEGQVGVASENLSKAMRKADLDPDEGREFFGSLMSNIHGGTLFNKTVIHSDAEVQKAAREFATVWSRNFEAIHAIAKGVGLDLGKMDNYVPLVRSDHLNPVFEAMASKGVAIPVLDAMTDEEKLAASLLNEMFSTWSNRVRAGRKVVGDSEFTSERMLGKTVKKRDMGETTLFEVMDGDLTAFLDPVAMNEAMTAAMVRLAKQEQIPLPKDFAVLERNPYKIADKYMSSMGEAVNESVLIQEASAVGLVKSKTWQIDKGRLASNVAEKVAELSPATRKALEDALEEANKVAGLINRRKQKIAFPGDEAEIAELVGTPLKMKTVKLGHGVSWEVPADLMDHPVVRRKIEQAKRHINKKWGIRQAVKDERDRIAKVLKKQNLPDELANVLADAESIRPVHEVRISIETAMTEELEVLTAGAAEIAARQVAEGREAVKAASGVLAARRQANRKMKEEARKQADEAIRRTRKQAGTRPQRVARIDSKEGQAGLADQLKVSVGVNLETLAAQADNLPRGSQVAETLRKIRTALDDVSSMDEDGLEALERLIDDAGTFFDTMNGDVGSKMTLSEWMDTRYKRRRAMKATEQESLIRELDADPLIETPRVRKRAGKTDDIITYEREQWFAEFNELHGIDPRQLVQKDRKSLKVLLARNPETAEKMASHQAKRDALLSLGEGIADDKATKRSMQAMLIDAAEAARGAGKGQRRPKWSQFNYAQARAMDPDDFFLAYGEHFARAGTRTKEGFVPSTAVESILESHKVLHGAGLVGKQIDDALSTGLRAEFRLLAALYGGQDVWRNLNLRNTMERLVDASPLGAEYRLAGARGGKFQLESLEEVTTLTSRQLQRELKLAGWTDSIEEAQQAIARGDLSAAALSPEAKATLAGIPTADARALDELSEALKQGISGAVARAPGKAKASVMQAQRAEKLLNRISQHLLKRDASGKLPARSLKVLESIMGDDANLRDLKRVLPKREWSRLDQINQTLETVRAMRDATPSARQLINKNNALRNDLMFDPTQAKETLNEVTRQLKQARLDDAYEGAEGQLRVFEKITQVLDEVLGYGPDPATGRTRTIFASEAELDEIHELALEGRRLGKQLGFEDLTDVFDELVGGKVGAVPTAETANFVPASVFGLGGAGVEDMLVEADFGKFMEHTLRAMMSLQTPTGLSEYTRGMRQVLHWWKGMATVARPTFHVRNFLSAGWNNSMIDVRMGDYKFVAKHMRALQRGFKETGDWAAAARQLKDPKAAWYFEQAALAGVMDNTFANSELLGKAARRASASKLARANPLSSAGPLLNVGGHTMENIEGFMRLAAFVRHMPEEMLGSADERLLASGAAFANDMVNMVHFDYKNLTAAEEAVKQFIPFFVWTRRNLPLQMRTLVERPQMIARYNHLLHAANDEMASKDDIGPRRYGGQAFVATDIVMNEDTSFWSRLIIDPDIPVKDLFEIENPLSPSSYVNLVVGMLGPHLTTPLRSSFQEHYPTTAPVGWQTVTRAFNAMTDENVDFDDNPVLPSGVVALMRTLFPPASEFLTGFEDDPRRQQKLGIVDGDLGSRIRAGLMDLALPGLGVSGYSPQEEYGVYQSSMFNSPLSDMKKQGLIDPDTEEVVQEYMKLVKRNPTVTVEEFLRDRP